MTHLERLAQRYFDSATNFENSLSSAQRQTLGNMGNDIRRAIRGVRLVPPGRLVDFYTSCALRRTPWAGSSSHEDWERIIFHRAAGLVRLAAQRDGFLPITPLEHAPVIAR